MMLNWHQARNLLVVFGAYFCAIWLAHFASVGEAVSGIGASGEGRLGEVWLAMRGSMPRMLGSAAGTALLWFTLGTSEARRWSWVLAGLFVALGYLEREIQWYVEPDPVSHAIDLAVYNLAPVAACALAIWVLGRQAVDAHLPDAASRAAEQTRLRSTAVLTAWSVLAFIVGGTLGMQIAVSANVKEMGGWMIAAMDSGRRADVAFAQYRGGSFRSAKVALDRYAAYLEALKPSSPQWKPGEAPLLDEQGLAIEKLLTYGRVALMAEGANQPDVAADYWRKADEQALLLEWEEPVRPRILETISRLDSPTTRRESGAAAR